MDGEGGPYAKERWFHGRMSRLQAEKLMEDYPNGTFLVRQREEGDELSVSVRYN